MRSTAICLQALIPPRRMLLRKRWRPLTAGALKVGLALTMWTHVLPSGKAPRAPPTQGPPPLSSAHKAPSQLRPSRVCTLRALPLSTPPLVPTRSEDPLLPAAAPKAAALRAPDPAGADSFQPRPPRPRPRGPAPRLPAAGCGRAWEPPVRALARVPPRPAPRPRRAPEPAVGAAQNAGLLRVGRVRACGAARPPTPPAGGGERARSEAQRGRWWSPPSQGTAGCG